MQKSKKVKDRYYYHSMCIKMTLIFYSVQSSFYALVAPEDNPTAKKIAVLLKNSTLLSKFLREVKISEVTFKYFNSDSISVKPNSPLDKNYYYFLIPNWEEYKAFIHELITEKFDEWLKEKNIEADHFYLDKYLKIIDQGIDSFEIKNNL